VEPVAKAWQVSRSRPPLSDDLVHGAVERQTLAWRGRRREQLDALLAGAAVHVAEHGHAHPDGTVQADTAGRRHPGGRDRGRVRSVVDRATSAASSRRALVRARQFAAAISQIISTRLVDR
jgi:hypothetical protein